MDELRNEGNTEGSNSSPDLVSDLRVQTLRGKLPFSNASNRQLKAEL